MGDSERWRAIRARAIGVEFPSTEVDPDCSNDLSDLLSGSNALSLPFDDDSSGDGLRSDVQFVPMDKSKLLSGCISYELQSATMAPTGPYVRILLNCDLARRTHSCKRSRRSIHAYHWYSSSYHDRCAGERQPMRHQAWGGAAPPDKLAMHRNGLGCYRSVDAVCRALLPSCLAVLGVTDRLVGWAPRDLVSDLRVLSRHEPNTPNTQHD
jgi:hypothetical protein